MVGGPGGVCTRDLIEPIEPLDPQSLPFRIAGRGWIPAGPVLHVMSASGDLQLAELVARVGLAATRHELLVALGRWMRSHAAYAMAAVLANFLLPGLRMM